MAKRRDKKAGAYWIEHYKENRYNDEHYALTKCVKSPEGFTQVVITMEVFRASTLEEVIEKANSMNIEYWVES